MPQKIRRKAPKPDPVMISSPEFQELMRDVHRSLRKDKEREEQEEKPLIDMGAELKFRVG